MVTMSAVAKQAGVSTPTASLVLNARADAVGISAETQRRVLDVAAQLGYRRNELVRSVVSGKNRRLGFLAYNHQEHVLRLLAGAMQEATTQGYVIEWHPLYLNQRDNLATIGRCVEQRLPGVMVVQVENETQLDGFHRELARHAIPVALIDSSFAHSWGVRVVSDDQAGAKLAVEHLVSLGHREIVFLAGAENSGSSAAREAGYRATMQTHGLAPRVERTDWSAGAAEALVARLMQESAPPTALFCANDVMALAAMRAARAEGFACPQKLSVVGYANLNRTGLSDPALTTIEQPFEEMGKLTVRALLERLEGGPKIFDEAEEVLVPVQLIERNSTAAPRAA